jgi:hypothetical protein
MHKVRDVLRFKHTLGMSLRQISEATGIGKTVVGEYVRRAGVIGITWPVPEAIDDRRARTAAVSGSWRLAAAAGAAQLSWAAWAPARRR